MAAAAATSTSKWINKPKLFSSSLPRQLGSSSTTISLKKPNKKQPMCVELQQSRRGAVEEPRMRSDDPSSWRAKLPVEGLMVLLAVIAVVEALPVDTLKSHPSIKAATVIVLFAFGSLIVIWLKLEQPRITNGSVCQFLVIRLIFTVGFVCMAFIVSGFIPDGHGWMIYMSVTGTTSCILVAWDIASMFRAAVRAETLNP